MQRRIFLKSLATLPIAYLFSNTTWANKLKGKASNYYKLEAQQIEWHIFSKNETATKIWSFDNKLFGKPIYANQNEKLAINVSNNLNQELGVHWHGIRLNNDMDGIPGITQKPILKGRGVFEYRFTPPDAGTYWYHAHSNSSEQVEKGLLGPLIVKETKKYPVDEELILLIKDWKLDDRFQIVEGFQNRHEMLHGGRLGTISTVNGKYRPDFFYKTYSRLRLRFINGSNAQILSLDLSTFDQATLIAFDGNPVEPQKYKPIYLAPGMRMDIIVDINSSKQAYPIFDTYTGKRNKLTDIYTTAKKIRNKPLLNMPKPLPANPVPAPQLNRAKEIDITLEGGAMSMNMMRGMMSGIFWTINGKGMLEDHSYKRPLLSLKKNKSYIFNIKNNTRFAHPMHIHGHTFKVLTKKPYWSDTILLLPNESKKVALVADNPGLWMFHCHILEHQISGMMGVIEIA